MKELSLHILDIMQNSIAADATVVELNIIENVKEDYLKFTIKDNGKGMTEDFLKSVTDPFITGRTTRKVGLGIPLLKLAAESTGGGIEISSKLSVGTVISATFGYSHIDRQPLGNMADTILGIITSYESIRFIYSHTFNKKTFSLDTEELHNILGGISFKEPSVMLWLKEYLKENEEVLVN